MAASARVAYLARRASDYGVQTGPVKVNLAQVRERKQKVVERFRNGAEQVLEATANLDVIRGEASFIDARTVKVEGAGNEALRLSDEKIFINTGRQAGYPSDRRTKSSAVFGFDFDHGAGRAAETSPDHGWRLHRH